MKRNDHKQQPLAKSQSPKAPTQGSPKLIATAPVRFTRKKPTANRQKLPIQGSTHPMATAPVRFARKKPIPKSNHPATPEELATLSQLRADLSAQLGFDLPTTQVITEKQKDQRLELPPITPEKTSQLPAAQLTEAAQKLAEIAQTPAAQTPAAQTPAAKSKTTKTKKILTSPFTIGIGTAAALLLALFTLPHLFTSRPDTLTPTEQVIAEAPILRQITSGEELRHVKLPDGTHLYLNQATSLTLRKGKFNAHTREIWLDHGEVFFDVAKDPNRPFIIHTPDGMSVKVLGTSFNISAYPELPEQVVSVKTGKVMVHTPQDHAIYLTPSHAATYHPTEHTLTPSTVDPDLIAVWRKGEIHLQDATPQEVALRLAHTRGIELRGTHHLPTDTRIHAYYTTQTTNREIAEALAQVYGVRYKFSDNILTFY